MAVTKCRQCVGDYNYWRYLIEVSLRVKTSSSVAFNQKPPGCFPNRPCYVWSLWFSLSSGDRNLSNSACTCYTHMTQAVLRAAMMIMKCTWWTYIYTETVMGLQRFKETYFMPSMPVFKTIWIRNNCDFVLSSGSYGNAVVAGFL